MTHHPMAVCPLATAIQHHDWDLVNNLFETVPDDCLYHGLEAICDADHYRPELYQRLITFPRLDYSPLTLLEIIAGQRHIVFELIQPYLTGPEAYTDGLYQEILASDSPEVLLYFLNHVLWFDYTLEDLEETEACDFQPATIEWKMPEYRRQLTEMTTADPSHMFNNAQCFGFHKISRYLLSRGYQPVPPQIGWAISGGNWVVTRMLMTQVTNQDMVHLLKVTCPTKQRLLLDLFEARPDFDPQPVFQALVRGKDIANWRMVQRLLKYPSLDPSIHNNQLLTSARADGRAEMVKTLLTDPRVLLQLYQDPIVKRMRALDASYLATCTGLTVEKGLTSNSDLIRKCMVSLITHDQDLDN